MTEQERGYADLALEERDGDWSLHARVSEAALNTMRSARYFMPREDSLFPPTTQYSVKLLGKEIINTDDHTKMARIVDYVDFLSLCMSYFDMEKNQIVSNGRFRNLALSSVRIDDNGRLGMNATIRRPKSVSDKQVATVATTAMQSVARTIGYLNEDGDLDPHKHQNLMDDMVGVIYGRDRGVTITTNPLGSCSLDTDGNRYDPKSDFIELYQHNLYNHTQQLLCLVGLVAVTNAETLVK